MKRSAWLTYAIAGIWAAVLIATAAALRGTPYSKVVVEILTSGVALTVVLLMTACRRDQRSPFKGDPAQEISRDYFFS